MAVLSKGQTFATGDQVTALKLNDLVDDATFVAGAVDNASTQLSGGAIIVKDGGVTTAKINDGAVTTAKIVDANVTKAKIENLSDYTVLGNVSGGAAAPAEVSILDEDNMASDSDTAIATQQSVKAYVDNKSASLTYFPLTNDNLVKSGNGTYNYIISDFTGPPDTSLIRDIYFVVEFYQIYFQEAKVFAVFPDGREHLIASDYSNDDNRTRRSSQFCSIPINAGQQTFTFRISDTNAGIVTVSLIGCRVV